MKHELQPDIERILRKVSEFKALLDGLRPLPADAVAELKKQNDVRLSYNSTAIEGNTLTQSETEMVIAHGLTIGGKKLSEHLEIIGHKQAIDYVEYFAQFDSNLTQWEMRQIHSLVLAGVGNAKTGAGSYRSINVVSAGTDHKYPDALQVKDLMDEFETWLIADRGDLHPVLYAAEAHYRFVATHPFMDGNGRVGRLLMNLLLLRAGYPHIVIPVAKRSQYIDALERANTGDMVPFYLLTIDECVESFRRVLYVLGVEI